MAIEPYINSKTGLPTNSTTITTTTSPTEYDNISFLNGATAKTTYTETPNGKSVNISATIVPNASDKARLDPLFRENMVTSSDVAIAATDYTPSVKAKLQQAYEADPYKVSQKYVDKIAMDGRKDTAAAQISASAKSAGTDNFGNPVTTKKDSLTAGILGDTSAIPQVDFISPTGLSAVSPSLAKKLTNTNDANTALLSAQMQATGDGTKNITPVSISSKRTNSGNLQDTIGGSDLSVFFLSEMPMYDDVIANPTSPDSWRKELVMFELDSVISISYSTIRERFPVRKMGNINAIDYTSGIRTIAGHLAFAVFVEDVLTRLRSQISSSFQRAKDSAMAIPKGNTSKVDPKYVNLVIDDAKKQQTILDNRQTLLSQTGIMDGSMMLDSLPPFSLLVMGMNERGSFSKFILKGVRIIDENQYQGTAYPNITNKVTFTAVDLVPMSKLNSSANSSFEIGQTNQNNVVSGSTLIDSIKKDLTKPTATLSQNMKA